MSRSYKKNPWLTDHTRKTTKQNKRLANQSFRKQIAQEEDMAARPQHRKYTDTYNISDWKSYMTEQEAIDFYLDERNAYLKKRHPTLKSWMNYWKKCYIRK